MVQNIWNLNLNPGINGPFWSLTYEWIFYITYGVFKFSRSFVKWPIILIILAFAGPSIISLFPAWLIGLFIYKAVRNSNFQQLRKKSLVIPIYLLTIFALATFSPIVRSINFENSIYLRASLLGDYFDALVFAFHIFFASYMSFTLKTNLLRFEKTIRWLGTLTFALYLFHRPILQTFAALFESYIGDLWYNISLLFIVFLIVCTLGRFCEKQKSLIKAKLNKYVVGFQH
jgi:peptidoglycan/LPS O-acetylase OafA/YrhL